MAKTSSVDHLSVAASGGGGGLRREVRPAYPDELQDPLQDPLSQVQILGDEKDANSGGDKPPLPKGTLYRPHGRGLAPVPEDETVDFDPPERSYRIQVDDADAAPDAQGDAQDPFRRGRFGSVHQPQGQDDMQSLYKAAHAAEGPFKALVEALIQETGAVQKTTVLKPYDRKEWVKDHPNQQPETVKGRYVKAPKTVSSMGPMKDQDRAQKKAETEYGGDVSKLLDVVRATLVYKDCGGVLAALDAIEARHEVKVARTKNKMDAQGRGALGYGDVTLNISIHNHVCELQLQIEAMAQIKPALHAEYGQYRDIGGGQNLKTVDDPKGRAMMRSAVHASQDLATDALVGLNSDPNYDKLMERLQKL